MKYDSKEYEKMILELNLNKSKKTIWLGTLISMVLVFIVTTLIEKDLVFNIVLAIGGGIATFFYSKKAICDIAKKINFAKDIICVEQEIFTDKIVESVTKKDNIVNSGEFFYKDVVFVKWDKLNFYLYFNNNYAVIVSKKKLNSIDDFKKVLKDNNLI